MLGHRVNGGPPWDQQCDHDRAGLAPADGFGKVVADLRGFGDGPDDSTGWLPHGLLDDEDDAATAPPSSDATGEQLSMASSCSDDESQRSGSAVGAGASNVALAAGTAVAGTRAAQALVDLDPREGQRRGGELLAMLWQQQPPEATASPPKPTAPGATWSTRAVPTAPTLGDFIIEAAHAPPLMAPAPPRGEACRGPRADRPQATNSTRLVSSTSFGAASGIWCGAANDRMTQEEDLCWDFARRGVCPRGVRCRWLHPSPRSQTSSADASLSPPPPPPRRG